MWLFSSFQKKNEAKEDVQTFTNQVKKEVKNEEPKKEIKKESVQVKEVKEEKPKVEEPKKEDLISVEKLDMPKIDSKDASPNATIEQLFKRYLDHSHKDDDEDSDSGLKDCITGEGLLLFAQDLGIEPVDPLMLIIFCKNIFFFN